MKIELTYYLVMTSNYKWGRGETLRHALMAAGALNPKDKLRRGIRVEAFKNTQTKKDVLTERRIKSFSPHYVIEGYKAGDYLLPFVNAYGNPVYYGEMDKIEGFDFI